MAKRTAALISAFFDCWQWLNTEEKIFNFVGQLISKWGKQVSASNGKNMSLSVFVGLLGSKLASQSVSSIGQLDV